MFRPSVCLCMYVYVCVSVWCLCVQVEKALEERKNEVETLRQQVICVAQTRVTLQAESKTLAESDMYMIQKFLRLGAPKWL